MSGDFSFLKGSIYTIILCSLYGTDEKSGDKYGYEIVKEIKERTDNKYEIKQPTLYSYLKKLEQQDLIDSYWGTESNGGRRRYYTLTPKGRHECQQFIAEWNYHKSVLSTLVDTENAPSNLEISQKDATPLFGERRKRATVQPSQELAEQDEITRQLNALMGIEEPVEEPTTAHEKSEISDANQVAENDDSEPDNNLEFDNASETSADADDDKLVFEEWNDEDESEFAEEDEDESELEELVGDTIEESQDETEISGESNIDDGNAATDDRYVPETYAASSETVASTAAASEQSDGYVEEEFSASYAEQPATREEPPKRDEMSAEEHKSKFQVRQDDADEFMLRFDEHARVVAESRDGGSVKKQPKETEENYQHVLMNVIGDQLDDMREYQAEQHDGAQKYYTDHPVALEDVADGLAKEGIRLRIYSRASANYKSKTLMPVSGALCKSAWLTYLVAVVYFGVLIFTSIANQNWRPFLITLAILAVFPAGLTIFALSDPSRKEKPLFDVKKWLLGTGILAAIIFLAALGISIISGIELNNYAAVSAQILLPLGIAILLPSYVAIFHGIYKKY